MPDEPTKEARPKWCQPSVAQDVKAPWKNACIPQPPGAAMRVIESICAEFVEARRHGQQKYGGDNPIAHDLSHSPREWWTYIRDHLERARPEQPGELYVMTLEEREHLAKAGGLILSAIWCADVKAGRCASGITTKPGAAMRVDDARAERIHIRIKAMSIKTGLSQDAEDLLDDRAEMLGELARLRELTGWASTFEGGTPERICALAREALAQHDELARLRDENAKLKGA